jgi:hypothetical protein
MSLFWMFLQLANACPGAHASYTCDAGGTDVCAFDASDRYVCDLAANGETTGGDLTLVANFSSTEEYSAWGTDAAGYDFCCEGSHATLHVTAEVLVYGSTYADEIALSTSVAGTSYDLEWPTSKPVPPGAGAPGVPAIMAWEVWAGSGDDTITGSDTPGTASTTVETLDGEGGNDTIDARAGDDTVLGGFGHDTVYGGPGDDVIRGQFGFDTLYGNAGDDQISGGSGDDDLFGGTDDDTLCGDRGADVVDGMQGLDVVYNLSSFDESYGGPGAPDFCDGAAGVIAGCEGSVLWRPASCPAP